MKIRTDFVTNSSSSSFVIGFKFAPDENNDEFRKIYNRFIIMLLQAEGSWETSEAVISYSLDEFRKKFFKHYRWSDKHGSLEDIIDSDDYLKRRYERCVKAINEGYNVAIKDIDYNDEALSDMFKTIAGEFPEQIKIVDSDY